MHRYKQKRVYKEDKAFLVNLTKCDPSSPDDGRRPETPRPQKQKHSSKEPVKTEAAKDRFEEKNGPFGFTVAILRVFYNSSS